MKDSDGSVGMPDNESNNAKPNKTQALLDNDRESR